MDSLGVYKAKLLAVLHQEVLFTIGPIYQGFLSTLNMFQKYLRTKEIMMLMEGKNEKPDSVDPAKFLNSVHMDYSILKDTIVAPESNLEVGCTWPSTEIVLQQRPSSDQVKLVEGKSMEQVDPVLHACREHVTAVLKNTVAFDNHRSR